MGLGFRRWRRACEPAPCRRREPERIAAAHRCHHAPVERLGSRESPKPIVRRARGPGRPGPAHPTARPPWTTRAIELDDGEIGVADRLELGRHPEARFRFRQLRQVHAARVGQRGELAIRREARRAIVQVDVEDLGDHAAEERTARMPFDERPREREAVLRPIFVPEIDDMELVGDSSAEQRRRAIRVRSMRVNPRARSPPGSRSSTRSTRAAAGAIAA